MSIKLPLGLAPSGPPRNLYSTLSLPPAVTLNTVPHPSLSGQFVPAPPVEVVPYNVPFTLSSPASGDAPSPLSKLNSIAYFDGRLPARRAPAFIPGIPFNCDCEPPQPEKSKAALVVSARRAKVFICMPPDNLPDESSEASAPRATSLRSQAAPSRLNASFRSHSTGKRAPGQNRTGNLGLRSPLLYPV